MHIHALSHLHQFPNCAPLSLPMQWVSISDALARFATKEMTLPPPQFTMATFLHLFPSLPCLHAFALHSFLAAPPQRMLPVRVLADKKIVVSPLCSLSPPHSSHITHLGLCLHCTVHCCLLRVVRLHQFFGGNNFRVFMDESSTAKIDAYICNYMCTQWTTCDVV